MSSQQADLLALAHGVDLDVELMDSDEHFVSYIKAPEIFGALGLPFTQEEFRSAWNPDAAESLVNVAVAAQVTANARCILRSYIRKVHELGEHVYYCATDSLYTDIRQPD